MKGAFYLASLSVLVSCMFASSNELDSNAHFSVNPSPSKENIVEETHVVADVPPRLRLDTLKLLAKEALQFNKRNGLDTTQCILIDMWQHPGTKRLFLWDFKKDTIVKSALVSQGACNEDNGTWRPVFKNVHESHCSSKGKYKTGARVWSSFGVGFSYKLHGLEATNSLAYDRVIVFHSWAWTPDEEVYPYEISYSWGCPAVSDSFMLEIDKDIKQLKRPILLWVFE
ncbi:MAG: murein L,D-transpeptidase catalytic domain-containing protein [Bacteroidia bacterium]